MKFKIFKKILTKIKRKVKYKLSTNKGRLQTAIGLLVCLVLILGVVLYHTEQKRQDRRAEAEYSQKQLERLEYQRYLLDLKLKQYQQLKEKDSKKKKQLQKEIARLKELSSKRNSAKAPAPIAPSLGGGCDALRKDLARLGVPSDQLNSAIILAQRESGCSHSAVNPSSGACGIFQSLPCGKWGSPGTDEYLRGAIAYANDRYGGYNGALAHSNSHGWY